MLVTNQIQPIQYIYIALLIYYTIVSFDYFTTSIYIIICLIAYIQFITCYLRISLKKARQEL